MNLAHEIAEYIDDRQSPGGAMTASGMEAIIADKLQLLKAHITRAKDYSRSAGCKAALIEALEMLEEES